MLFALIVGVITEFHLKVNAGFFLTASFSLVLVLFSLPALAKQKLVSRFFGLMILCAFTTLGSTLAHLNNSLNSENYFWTGKDSLNADFVGMLTSNPEYKENSIKLEIDILSKNDKSVQGRTLLYIEKDSSVVLPKYGELIAFNAKFNEIRANNNPKEFDYSRYLKIHDIHHQCYVQSSDWKSGDFIGNSLKSMILSWRTNFSEVISNSGMKDENTMVANALLLGQKEYLSEDVLRSYSSAGAMHVLAVSGLHVGIVMLIFGFFLKPIKKMKNGKLLFLVLMLIAIWFYALITGLSPSVLRAAVMFSFIVIGQELQRETSIYQSIMVSAFVLILIEPYIIFQVGFQLSYLAVLGIVYLQPKIYNAWFIKNKILDKAWQITAVSIAAQLATFPLGLYYFHQFPNFFLISNLIVIPLAFVLLIVGIVYLALHWIPAISDLVLWVFDSVLTLLNIGVEWIEKLPYSVLWGISIHWFEVFLIYTLIVSFTVSIVKKSAKVLIASLSILMLLIGINVNEKISISSEQKLFIYNIKNELAFDVFYGEQNRFYSSEDFYCDESALLFHVKHNWFYRSGKEKPTEWIDNSLIDNIHLGEYEISFLTSTSLYLEDHNVDYYVIYDLKFLEKPRLEKLQNSDAKLIIGPQVGYGLRNTIDMNFEKERIFDLKEDGCFELDF